MLSFWESQSFVQYDFIVIGSGIVGLSAACSLRERAPQARILVLERGMFPSGASTKNAGFACYGSLTEVLADIARIGEAQTLQLIAKRWQGLQKMLGRLGASNIDFQGLGGYELISEQELSALDKLEYINQLVKPIFGKAVYSAVSAKIAQFGFNPQFVKALIFNELEGQIHTGKMMQALLTYTQKQDIRILNNCQVNRLETIDNEVQITVNEHVHFKAAKVAVCTNAFAPELFPELAIAPGRGQVLVTQPLKNLRFAGTFHYDEGFYYFRNIENRVLFGGGRNLAFAQETTTEFATTDLIMNDLQQKLQEIILPNQSFEIDQTWAGIMAFTPNHEPIVRLHSPQVALGVALNGMGVAIGSLVGAEVAELLVN
ncbi:MAG: FAD-binding oxidoreductase [Microscillaceae bacterium]|jgi:glycine/D-amino acid oxidase-like deaminating enzyme|nr:FAD-binding oxidoreductase [Microscillaceae bacterium]